MGGIGSGGQPGVGRKPKDREAAFVQGQRGAKPVKRGGTVVEHVPVPDDLPAEQREVWEQLGPHAAQQRTLTKATAQAFRDLCEAIVLKRSMVARLEQDGLTYVKVSVDGAGNEHSELKAHPLVSQHRGMMQRVEAGMTRFRLAPVGKELAPTVKEDDPFEEFDEQETVQ